MQQLWLKLTTPLLIEAKKPHPFNDMATIESPPPVRDEEDNEERDKRNEDNDQEGLKEEKEKLMMEILELQNTLHDLSQRIHAVKEENEQLQTDNQVILLALTEITIKIISLL